MITITGLEKHYGGQVLFSGVDLQLHDGARYGIVGANGAGKSTLLRIISGEESASSGDVQLPRKARIGVLEQDHFAYEDTPIIEVVMQGAEELWADMQAKERMLDAADAGGDFDADRFAALEERILQRGGYELEARAAEILDGHALGRNNQPRVMARDVVALGGDGVGGVAPHAVLAGAHVEFAQDLAGLALDDDA